MRPSKRNELIEATIEMVAEKGIHDVPTIQIARRAEVAEITLFRNFQTKENLLDETFEVVLKRAQDFIYENIDENLPLKERFLLMCQGYCLFGKEHPMEFDVFQQYYFLPLSDRRSYLSDPPGTTRFDKVHRKGLVKLLLDGQNDGQIRPVPVATLLGIVFGALFNLDLQMAAEQQQEVFELLWDGLSVP